MLERIVFPLCASDFVSEHPCAAKPAYFAQYVGGVLPALLSLGVPVARPTMPMRRYEVGWDFGERFVWTGVCYSDFPEVGDWSGVDGLFKMKWHPGRVGGVGLPVFAGGFVPSGRLRVDWGVYRELKDGRQEPGCYWNAGHFRVLGPPSSRDYPNRERFRAELGDGACCRGVGYREWLECVARSRYALNLCGNGNSIDKKVVEMCAMGVAMLSDRGLEDLALPWGRRFEHGLNVWFVDEPCDVLRGCAQIDESGLWERLVAETRALWRSCFGPKGMGRWYLKCAESLL